MRRTRLVERDLRWGATVRKRWDHLELTGRDTAAHQVRPADPMIDDERPLAENVTRLTGLIRDHLSEGSHEP